MQTLDLKHCPICEKDLPVSEFGLCRARKDGKNLYCKSCIREKVKQSRIGQKNWRQVQKERRAKAVEALLNPTIEAPGIVTAADRVFEAIANGARTQHDIAVTTKLSKDEIGDAIANLLLWAKKIETKVVEDRRLYFIREVIEQPKRKDCVLSLSCFGPVIRGSVRAA